MADLYPTVPSIRRIVHDAELEQWRIDFNAAVIDIWHAVLTEAEKVDKLPELLAIIHTEYGSNERFRQIYRDYMKRLTPVSGSGQTTQTQRKQPLPPTEVQRRLNVLLGTFALVVLLIVLMTQWGSIGKLLTLANNSSPTVENLAVGTQSPTPTLLSTVQITPTATVTVSGTPEDEGRLHIIATEQPIESITAEITTQSQMTATDLPIFLPTISPTPTRPLIPNLLGFVSSPTLNIRVVPN